MDCDTIQYNTIHSNQWLDAIGLPYSLWMAVDAIAFQILATTQPALY